MYYILSKGDFQFSAPFEVQRGAEDRKGAQGRQKTPMKIEIRPISMKFKPYILHNA